MRLTYLLYIYMYIRFTILQVLDVTFVVLNCTVLNRYFLLLFFSLFMTFHQTIFKHVLKGQYIPKMVHEISI